MVDHMVETSRPRGRVDVQVGAARRRRWSDEAKGRIVAESYAPGAVVSEVARRHDISAQHLFAWRKAARRLTPTGRAAKRMTEATGFEAKTIHRLLEVDPKGG